MKHLIVILVLCAGIHLNAGAQTFTQRVQQSTPSKGKVTIHQSDEIDRLVNNAKLSSSTQATPTTPTTLATTPTKPAANTPATVSSSTDTSSETFDSSDSPIDYSKKIMKGGVKINGYRVQAFAGGNSRKDRIEAERVGDKIKANYPNEPVYVHFYSPRWICRVGNYRTYEEAHQMLLSVRKLGFIQATIVKGKITVQQY